MRRLAIACASALLAWCATAAPAAGAAEGEQTATWSLEQPSPPPPPPGVAPAAFPVSLGKIGDIEFWEPPGEAPQANRGLLITHGNGETVPAGVWAYDGSGWHEIAKVCGATEGRIAWSGPADFWTVSDGRTGQAENNGQPPPLQDNSLCHFSHGSIVASYAHLAFQANSYLKMFGAACLPPQPPDASSTDCWFGGEALDEPQIGSFHLHWNGSTLEEDPYMNQGDPVREMRQLEGAIFESVEYSSQNRHNEPDTGERPPLLHVAEAETAMQPLSTEELPLFPSSEDTEALEYLHLGATEGVLWAATGRRPGSEHTKEHEANEKAQVTVLRRLDGVWTQVIGPEGGARTELPKLFASAEEEHELLGGEAKHARVQAIAPEPGSEDAWLALASANQSEAGAAAATAVLVHISAQGAVLGVQTLPSTAERELPSDATGAAERLACPALEDCWMANAGGWLYHLARAGERTLPPSELEGFPEGKIISERPPDEATPQEVLNAPPPDDSGLQEAPPDYGGTFAEQKAKIENNKVQEPLVTRVHSRLVKGTTLQLSFHLAVQARVRLVAKWHSKVIAQTRNEVLNAGERKLLLRLDRHRWPTKLALQTHALKPLPLVSSVSGEGANVTTEETGLLARPFGALLGEAGRLP
ncbi:MAG TPA: hypothetical protein VMD79_01090 [Solirubrobacteraceae bacterium]|nr:hypothetical protein [Solirubrobacteraceae bacterium]